MKSTIEYENVHGNRQYKSDLFCEIFKEKKDLLELYNAVNGTAYTNKEDLEVNIPTPSFVVFYNGMQEEPGESLLCLSEAFEKEGGCLECEARLININYGQNRELMEKCRKLEETVEIIRALME